jgi:hypothetical protein
VVKRSLSDDIIKGTDRPIPPSTRDLVRLELKIVTVQLTKTGTNSRVAANLRTTFFSTISVNPNFRNCVDLSMPNERACHGGSGKNKFIFVTLKIHEDMLD